MKNKKSNLIYKVEIIPQITIKGIENDFEHCKFKDLGYLMLFYREQKQVLTGWYQKGFITVDELKKLIGSKQYEKFCQGKREFIIQNNG